MPTINEKIKVYFKSGQKDYDAFDNILLQLQMHVMQNMDEGGLNEKKVPMLKEIKESFVRRATRKEFPSTNYIVYLRFSLMVHQDDKVLMELLQYGLDDIYNKLTWIDKTNVLEIAISMQQPYIKNILDRVAIDLLYNDNETLMAQINTFTII